MGLKKFTNINVEALLYSSGKARESNAVELNNICVDNTSKKFFLHNLSRNLIYTKLKFRFCKMIFLLVQMQRNIFTPNRNSI